MHIVLASENNYAPFVAVTLVSILRTSPALPCVLLGGYAPIYRQKQG